MILSGTLWRYRNGPTSCYVSSRSLRQSSAGTEISNRTPVPGSPVSCIVMSESSKISSTKKSENPVVDPTPYKKRSFLFSGGIPIPVIFTDDLDIVSCFVAADAIADGFWTSVTFTPPGPGFIFRLFQQYRWGGGITLQRSVRCRFGSHFAPPDLSKILNANNLSFCFLS